MSDAFPVDDVPSTVLPIRRRTIGADVVLHVAGEIDLTTVEALRPSSAR